MCLDRPHGLLRSHLGTLPKDLSNFCSIFRLDGASDGADRGVQWKDIDWFGKSINLERGVVAQIVDDVKTEASRRGMPVSDDLLELLKQWKAVSQFSGSEDWVFASPWKLGQQPICYTHIWESLDSASRKAGLPHVSSHALRNAFRSWPDSLGTPVGVQQRMMRHSCVTTTMNHYGTALKADLRAAHEKVYKLTGVTVRYPKTQAEEPQ